MEKKEQVRRSNIKSVRIMVVIAVFMFGFGYFVLVPLYDYLCEITGLNGKTGRLDTAQGNTTMAYSVADVFGGDNRWVTVQFSSSMGKGLPWEFKPLVSKMRVRLGEQNIAYYTAHNNSSETITGQAVPGVVPGRAARYFKKVECFCFTKQVLKPGETKKMPIRFVVQKGLDKRVEFVVLSYTFFNTDKASTKKYSSNASPKLVVARQNAALQALPH